MNDKNYCNIKFVMLLSKDVMLTCHFYPWILEIGVIVHKTTWSVFESQLMVQITTKLGVKL